SRLRQLAEQPGGAVRRDGPPGRGRGTPQKGNGNPPQARRKRIATRPIADSRGRRGCTVGVRPSVQPGLCHRDLADRAAPPPADRFIRHDPDPGPAARSRWTSTRQTDKTTEGIPGTPYASFLDPSGENELDDWRESSVRSARVGAVGMIATRTPSTTSSVTRADRP